MISVDLKGSSGKIDLSDSVFGASFNEDLVHQAVVAYLAGGRSGSKAQKTRAEVRGGGRKPFKQKGGGRARAGSIRSPLWRGGGKIFAAQPRDYSQKLNRTMYRTALRSMFSEIVRQGRLMVVDDFAVQEPKTKVFLAKADALQFKKGVLIVNELTEALVLAARNLKDVEVISASEVNPALLAWADQVVISKEAVAYVEGWLQ
jgi:large subunit ribosomal protein L4